MLLLQALKTDKKDQKTALQETYLDLPEALSVKQIAQIKQMVG